MNMQMGNIREGNFYFSKQYFNSPKWCRYNWEIRANWENNDTCHL